jgi:hypothetical protein
MRRRGDSLTALKTLFNRNYDVVGEVETDNLKSEFVVTVNNS